MKIIEGLKRLHLLEKRMKDNIERIQQYASAVDIERFVFDTEARQRIEVAALVQANKDLLEEYLHLKRRIDATNAHTKVMVCGIERSIADWLTLRRQTSARPAPLSLLVETYSALNDTVGQERLRVATWPTDRNPHVVRFYNEEESVRSLQEVKELYSTIDPTLEVVNASTELLEVE